MNRPALLLLLCVGAMNPVIALAKIWTSPDMLAKECDVVVLGDIAVVDEDTVLITVTDVWLGDFTAEQVQLSQHGPENTLKLVGDTNNDLLHKSDGAIVCLWRHDDKNPDQLQAWSALGTRNGKTFYDRSRDEAPPEEPLTIFQQALERASAEGTHPNR